MGDVDVERLQSLTHIGGVVWGIEDGRSLEKVLDRLAAAETTVARIRSVVDEWDNEPSLPPSVYNLVDDIRAALGGDGGGMGPQEGAGGDLTASEGQGRVSGHLGERQDGSWER